MQMNQILWKWTNFYTDESDLCKWTRFYVNESNFMQMNFACIAFLDCFPIDKLD